MTLDSEIPDNDDTRRPENQAGVYQDFPNYAMSPELPQHVPVLPRACDRAAAAHDC